jgi:hypothetical protein
MATDSSIFIPPPVMITEVTLNSAAGSEVVKSTERGPYFYAWTLNTVDDPTSFTVTATVTGERMISETPVPIPVTVKITLTGSGYPQAKGPSSAVPVNLSSPSASGNGTATTTLDVNMADYGATPTNVWIATFQAKVTATSPDITEPESMNITVETSATPIIG